MHKTCIWFSTKSITRGQRREIESDGYEIIALRGDIAGITTNTLEDGRKMFSYLTSKYPFISRIYGEFPIGMRGAAYQQTKDKDTDAYPIGMWEFNGKNFVQTGVWCY